jgi:hypothetical protein
VDHTGITIFHASKGFTGNIRTCQLRVNIVYSSAVLTETYGYRIIWASVITLAGKYYALSSDIHLMDESLISKSINNTIEGSEIHPWLSFFSNKFFLEI